MAPKARYRKMGHIEHILNRPDTYLGSLRLKFVDEYITKEDEDGTFKISKESIKSSTGLLRIFIEVLSNAIDNVARSKETETKCTAINVTIDKETGKTSVWNDGDVVPIEKHEEEDCYNHSMIFGQLMTGSNYDDDEERELSGRNGLGVKLTNIYSQYMEVEGYDPNNSKNLKQRWTNNMRDTEGPKITSKKTGRGFTKVTWVPDFEKFEIKGYTDEIISMYTRYVIDAAMLTNVRVTLNGKQIKVANLPSYATLYSTPSQNSLHIKIPGTDVVVTPSNGEFQHISFINGVFTRLGGQHVDAWVEALFKPIAEKLNKKDQPVLTIRDIKPFFRLFVNSVVVRPEFDSQDKNKFEGPSIKAQVKKNQISLLLKWPVMSDIEDIIRGKEMAALKKTERKRKTIKIEGLDPANNAGTRLSKNCTLILCEGLSAKTYAVSGIRQGVYGRSGRDWFGVYPLRGKVLNVRCAPTNTITSNKVITDVIQALGLKYDTNYTIEKNFQTLRYGKVMIMTDADVDGIHIEGLLINFFLSLFPTLMAREHPFIVSMKTPIARVIKTKQTDLLFYDERNFKKYMETAPKSIKIKYYKGLGTTKPEDVPDTFGKKMVEFVSDEETTDQLNKVFHKKHADMRKEWLTAYNPMHGNFSLDKQNEISTMGITMFVNEEMIKFSHDDCKRSLPSGIDGLKESQRKVLHGVRKRKLRYGDSDGKSTKSLKVAQLGGYVAEHTNYHHGEQNLYDTIVKMAQDFTGSNNIPLLYRDGMFGTRLEGGVDAASARYIFTKLDELTDLIFREEDDNLLTYVNDDGDIVQPEYFVPILPMILINGCTGIGTGWSCKIPCYNPMDVVNNVRLWIECDGEVDYEDPDSEKQCSLYDEMIPWYKDFNGTIEKDGIDRYITKGICTRTKFSTVEVTELPIGMWTQKFKDQCEDLVDDKQLKSYKNYSDNKKIHFILTENDDTPLCDVDSLKLHSYLYNSNMVMFDHEGRIQKYKSVNDIITSFCKIRWSLYEMRKKYLIKELEKQISHTGNKERFINEVCTKQLKVMDTPEKDVKAELKLRKYDEDPLTSTGGYDYLLSMPVRNLTIDRLEKIRKELLTKRKSLSTIQRITIQEMWIRELNEFEKIYKKGLVSKC